MPFTNFLPAVFDIRRLPLHRFDPPKNPFFALGIRSFSSTYFRIVKIMYINIIYAPPLAVCHHTPYNIHHTGMRSNLDQAVLNIKNNYNVDK